MIAAGFDGGMPKRADEGSGAAPHARRTQTQEETRNAAAALGEAKRHEGARSRCTAGRHDHHRRPTRPPHATPGAAADAVRRRRPGRPGLPEVARHGGRVLLPHAATAPSTWPSPTGTAGSVRRPTTRSTWRSRAATTTRRRPTNRRLLLADFAPDDELCDLAPGARRRRGRAWRPLAWPQRPHADALVATAARRGADGPRRRLRAGAARSTRERGGRRGPLRAARAGRRGRPGARCARMRELGAGRITAWVGPHVCGALLRGAGGDARRGRRRRARQPYATTSWGTPSLDLGAGVRAQLERARRRRGRRDPLHPRVRRPLLLPPRRRPGRPARGAGPAAGARR